MFFSEEVSMCVFVLLLIYLIESGVNILFFFSQTIYFYAIFFPLS